MLRSKKIGRDSNPSCVTANKYTVNGGYMDTASRAICLLHELETAYGSQLV